MSSNFIPDISGFLDIILNMSGGEYTEEAAALTKDGSKQTMAIHASQLERNNDTVDRDEGSSSVR